MPETEKNTAGQQVRDSPEFSPGQEVATSRDLDVELVLGTSAFSGRHGDTRSRQGPHAKPAAPQPGLSDVGSATAPRPGLSDVGSATAPQTGLSDVRSVTAPRPGLSDVGSD